MPRQLVDLVENGEGAGAVRDQVGPHRPAHAEGHESDENRSQDQH